MADISKIKLPNGTEYNIKDAVAREIAGGGLQFRGVTTTAITDGAETTSYKIGTNTLTAANGDMVVYGNKEFVFSTADNKWHELGDNTAFKALAYKDSASGSYKPAGTVSKPTFTGSSSNVSVTVANNTNGNYTPAGTVSKPTFTGSEMTASGSFTPAGSVTVTTKTTTNKTATVAPAASGTVTYTPAGSVAAPTFTGTQATISSTGTYTPAGSVSLTNTNKTALVSKATSGDATYTPAGTVSAPTISVASGGAGTTTKIKNPTSVTVAQAVVAAAPGATAPSNSIVYYGVSGETLSLYQLGYTTGASITTTEVTVKTGDASYVASAPTFTGTGARLVTGNIPVPTSASFTGTEDTISSTATYTPAGSNSAPDFTGTGVRLVTGDIAVPATYTGSFTGTAGNVSVTGTPEGSVSQPTFSGTKVQISGTTTAAGSVSQPTFDGTQATITVS